MEASFMTHVPCPPVKITPAVFQGCSITGRAANENNGACGEETKQTQARERKTSSWTEIPAAGFESHQREELLEDRGFSGAIAAGDLPEALGGTLFCSRRVFWVKDASMRGPAARVWATGFGFFFQL